MRWFDVAGHYSREEVLLARRMRLRRDRPPAPALPRLAAGSSFQPDQARGRTLVDCLRTPCRRAPNRYDSVHGSGRPSIDASGCDPRLPESADRRDFRWFGNCIADIISPFLVARHSRSGRVGPQMLGGVRPPWARASAPFRQGTGVVGQPQLHLWPMERRLVLRSKGPVHQRRTRCL